MPRGPRLDVPDALYHVIARGVGRGPIFVDDRDRQGFLERLAALVGPEEITLFAYVLMGNHFHLVLRRGGRRLATFMARLLTGHAVVFNLRHRHAGHLFQNRYRSIVCETEAYLLQLVRYTHLNPVRAQLTMHPADYPWSSYGAYLARHPPAWLDTTTVPDILGGREAFTRFTTAGLGEGRRPDLSGYAVRAGGSAGARVWEHGQVLGSEDFARATVRWRRDGPTRPHGQAGAAPAGRLLALARHVAEDCAVSVAAIRSGSRQPEVAAARRRIIRQAVEVDGVRPVDVAAFLAVTRSAVTHSRRRHCG